MTSDPGVAMRPSWRSTVAGRLLTASLLVIAAFAAMLWIEWSNRTRDLANLRQEISRRADAHLSNLVKLDQMVLVRLCKDYSLWDEFAAACAGGSREWYAHNLTPTLVNYPVDGLAVLTTDGATLHLAGRLGEHLATACRRLGISGLLAQRTGMFTLRLNGRATDVVFATIHGTADLDRASKPAGLLLICREWSDQRLGELSSLFGDPVQVHKDDAAQDDWDMLVSHGFTSPPGEEPLALTGHRHYPAMASFERQARRHLLEILVLGGTAILGMAAMALLLAGWPLRRLAGALLTDNLVAVEQLTRRRDEVGEVALAAATALRQRRRLDEEIAERRRAEEAQRQAQRDLEAQLAGLRISEEGRRAAELRTALALQGGNLCLWEYIVDTRTWRLDHEWLAVQGVFLDPQLSDREALQAVMAAEDYQTLASGITQALSASGQVEIAIRVKRLDGSRLWLMLRGTVSDRAADGAILRLAGSMLDVTRWRELEQQLRQAHKLEAIGQLAAGIAHEINTPIQFIGDNTRFAANAFSDLLALQARCRQLLAGTPGEAAAGRAEQEADLPYLQSEVPKALAQSQEGIERVAQIVGAMKEFAHPAGSDPVPTDLNHLIANAATISRNTWKSVAELELRADPGLPPVPVYPSDLGTAILNLIINAAQAIEDAQRTRTRQGQGRIVITTRIEDGHAVISIEDNGCGMPDEVQSRIYEPFFTTKEVGRGSGQGLPIARQIIVGKHGGEILCRSQPGTGTTFDLRLPLTRQSVADRPSTGMMAERPTT